MPNFGARPRGKAAHGGRRTPPNIGNLRELVVVSTMIERPDGDVSTIVLRPGVIRVNARVLPITDIEVLNYLAVFGTELKPPSVEIAIRYPPDISIGINHWVYHQDKHVNVDTWYRVRTLEDLRGIHRFLMLGCSIDGIRDHRRDPATQPAPPKWRTPMDDTLLIDRMT